MYYKMSTFNLNDSMSEFNPFQTKEIPEDTDTFQDLADNLKTQMVLHELDIYFKKTEFDSKQIRKLNRLKGFKYIFTIIYFILLFFEKPFWCFRRTTFWTNDLKENDECDENIITLGSYIDVVTYRTIEITIITLLSLIQMTVIKEKNIKYQKLSYYRIVVLLDILYILCFIDILFAMIFSHFPYVNFLLRPLVIVFQKKNLRREWLKIFEITYITKSLLFILFFIIIVFSLIGHLLFSLDNNEFSSFFSSLDTMFIVLTTCNFPDIMLKTFPISQFCIIFFVSYLLINFFVFLSLLKALYYVSYVELNKEKAAALIQRIKINKNLIDSKVELKNKLVELNNKFLFSRIEYKRLKELLGVNKESDNNMLLRTSTINFFSQSQDDMMKTVQHEVLRILRSKKTETIVNVVNLLVIGLGFIKKKNLANDIIQMSVCIYFIIEFFIYVRYYTLKKMILHKMMRFGFFLVCSLSFIILLSISIMELYESKQYIDDLINIIKPLIIFRSIRLLMLLSSFDEYKTIFTTLRNMKPMFYNMMATQFSFFVIFSTISMVILGGKVKVDQYKDNPTIPGYYSHLNFNCFPSAFLTCFTLVMMNNMNVVTDALSQPVGVILKAYFSLFYFLGIINILNLCQTYIMEMYVVTKKSKKSED